MSLHVMPSAPIARATYQGNNKVDRQFMPNRQLSDNRSAKYARQCCDHTSAKDGFSNCVPTYRSPNQSTCQHIFHNAASPVRDQNLVLFLSAPLLVVKDHRCDWYILTHAGHCLIQAHSPSPFTRKFEGRRRKTICGLRAL